MSILTLNYPLKFDYFFDAQSNFVCQQLALVCCTTNCSKHWGRPQENSFHGIKSDLHYCCLVRRTRLRLNSSKMEGICCSGCQTAHLVTMFSTADVLYHSLDGAFSARWICSRFLVWRPGYDVYLPVSLAQFWWIKDDASIFHEGGDLHSSLYQSPCFSLSSPLTCRKISLFPEKHPWASLALLQSFTDSPSVGGRLLTVLEQQLRESQLKPVLQHFKVKNTISFLCYSREEGKGKISL